MRGMAVALAIALTVVAVRAQNTHVVLQPPTVTGPVAEHDAAPSRRSRVSRTTRRRWTSPSRDMSRRSSSSLATANRYNTPSGERGSVIDVDHPYTTRLVVRRPRQAARFNGTAIVEWYNVSQGHDGEYEWFQSYAHLLRSGYAWVGVSTQAVGVNALKEWSPMRYGSLDVRAAARCIGDALSYDIFSGAALAIRGKANRDVMGGLRVQRLIATGHSQSAGRLYNYFHSVHPLTSKLYDAVLLHGGGGRVSPDLNVKVFKYLDESDVIGQANARMPDSNGYRQWEVAGSSHLDAQFSRSMAALGLRVSGMRPVESSPPIGGPSISGGEKGNGAAGNGAGVENEGVNGGCAQPPFSRVPSYHVLNAAFDATHRWLADGVAPPSAPPIELKQLPASSLPPSAADAGRRRGRPGPRWEIVRDEMGLARGGIRLAAVAARSRRIPATTSAASGAVATGGGERNCRLDGIEGSPSMRPARGALSDARRLRREVQEATEKNLKAGFITKWDADATIRDAENSKIGRYEERTVVERACSLDLPLMQSTRTAAR